ncbi:hypothetical protein [Bacillus infantis]|nr:hypothetical protein [Bacillus infantis]
MNKEDVLTKKKLDDLIEYVTNDGKGLVNNKLKDEVKKQSN